MRDDEARGIAKKVFSLSRSTEKEKGMGNCRMGHAPRWKNLATIIESHLHFRPVALQRHNASMPHCRPLATFPSTMRLSASASSPFLPRLWLQNLILPFSSLLFSPLSALYSLFSPLSSLLDPAPLPMEVQLYVYDLSRGAARSLSGALLGVQIDAVYHTSIIMGGIEYVYDGGIKTVEPGKTHLGQPMQIIDLGATSLPMDVIMEYLESLKEIYTPEVCLCEPRSHFSSVANDRLGV